MCIGNGKDFIVFGNEGIVVWILSVWNRVGIKDVGKKDKIFIGIVGEKKKKKDL